MMQSLLIIPIVQESKIGEISESKNKRNLIEIDGYSFPMSFAMDDTTSTSTGCTDDITLNGFTISQGDSGNQMILAGRISPASGSSCSRLTNGGSSVSNFITSFSSAGTLKWYNLVASSSYQFNSLVSSNSYVIAAYSSTSDIRILKIALSDGSLALERAISDIYYTISAIQNLNLQRLGYTTAYNFMSFGYTDSSTAKNMIMKFDDNLSISWTRILTTSASQALYQVVDFANQTTSLSSMISLNLLVDTSSNYYWTLHSISGSTGGSNGEMSMYSPTSVGAPTVYQGVVKCDSVYFFGAITVFSQTTNTNSLAVFSQKQSNFGALTTIRTFNQALYSPQMEIVSSFVILSAYTASNNLRVFIMNSLMQQVGLEQRQIKGLAGTSTGRLLRMSRKSIFSDTFIAFQVGQYLSPTYPQRIVLQRVSYMGLSNQPDAIGLECLQNSSPLTVLTVSNSLSSTSIITNTLDTYPYFSLATTASLSYTATTLTASSSLSSILVETDTNLFEGSFYQSPDSYIAKTQSDNMFTWSSSAIRRCSGLSYTASSLLFNNGSSVSQPFSYNSDTSNLRTKFDEVEQTPDGNVGSQTFTVTTTTESSVTVQVPIRMQVDPPSSYTIDPLAYSVDVTTCEASTPVASPNPQPSALYPLFYGKTGMVQMNYFDVDDNGMLIVAGVSKTAPFSKEISRTSGIVKGFIGYIDQLANPIWIYYLDVDTTSSEGEKSTDCGYATQYTQEVVTKIVTPVIDQYGITVDYTTTYSTASTPKFYGLCLAYDQFTAVQRGVMVQINPGSGALETIRYLPRDYNDDTNYQPLLITGLTGTDLLLVSRYSQSTYSNFAAMRLSDALNSQTLRETYTPIWYNQYVDGTRTTIDSISLLVQNDTGFMYSFRHMGSSGEFITMIDLSTGIAKQTTTLSNQHSDGNTNQIELSDSEIALVTLDTSAYKVSLWQLNNTSLARKAGVQITLSSTVLPQGANVQIVSNQYTILVTGLVFEIIILSTDLSTVTSQTIWEYQLDNTGYFSIVNSANYAYSASSSAIFFAASGFISTSYEFSSIIFRIPSTADQLSCVFFRSILSEETGYAVTLAAISTTLTVTDVSGSATFTQSAIYRYTEFMTQADGVNLRTYSYETSNLNTRFDWGLQLIPQTYDYRFGQSIQQYQCGGYVRQTTHQGYSSVLLNGIAQTIPATQTTTYFEMTLGDILEITLNSPQPTCQGRNLELLVFSAGNSYQDFDFKYTQYSIATQTLIVDTSEASPSLSSNKRMLLGAENGLPEAGTYAFTLRYQDQYQGQISYFDHLLTVRVLPSSVRENTAFNSHQCFQNVLPVSFGGCSTTNCDMFVDAAVYDPTSSSQVVYLAGRAQQGNNYMDSTLQSGAAAYVMVINEVAIPQWYTSIFLEYTVDQTITAMAFSGEKIYAFFTTLEATYSQRQTAILKLASSDGFLQNSQTLSITSSTYGQFKLYSLRDMQIVPFNTNYNELSLSFSSYSQGSNMNVGNLRFQDNNDNTYSIKSQRYLKEHYLAVYQHGQQLFNSQSTSSTIYYESHLVQYTTKQAQLYLAKVNGNSVSQAQLFTLTGNLNIDGSLQPAMTMNQAAAASGGGDVYLAIYTDSYQYLLWYDLSANSYQYYSFSVTGAGALSNIDIACLTSQSTSYLVLSFVDSTATSDGQYFITFDTSLNIQLSIRYDQIAASITHKTHLLLASPTQDFFYYARNSPAFAYSASNSEVLVNKKSFSYALDNQYDCQASAIEASTIFTLSAAIITAPTALTVDTDVLSGTDLSTTVSFIVNPYIASIYMSDDELYKEMNLYPQSMQQYNSFYFEDSNTLTCAAANGIQAPYNQIPMVINVRQLENATSYTFNTSTNFTQCQSEKVTYQFKYETGLTTSPTDSSFILFNSSINTLTIDVSGQNPAPAGSRILELDLSTYQVGVLDSSSEKTSSMPLILHILPEEYDQSALLYLTKNYTCENDLDYPKVLGDASDTNDFIQYGFDLDEQNGNMLICGQSSANLYPNQAFYKQTQDMAVSIIADLMGRIYWSYTAQYIGTSDASYVDCSIGRNILDTDLTVYGLIYLEQQGILVYVEQDYQFGKVNQIRRIPGLFGSNLQSGLALSWDNSVLNFAVFGSRSDTDTTHGNEFSVFQSDTYNYYQIWNAYSTIATPFTTTPFITALAYTSDSDILVVSFVEQDSAGKYMNLAKYDGQSGQQTSQKSFSAGSLDATKVIKFDMEVDQSNNKVYVSYSNFAGSHSHILKSFDESLTLLGGVSVAISSSVASFESSLSFDSTYLYEHLHAGDNKAYVIQYLRSTLAVVKAAKFYDSTMSIAGYSMFLGVFDNSGSAQIMTFFSSKGFLSADHYQGVLNRVDSTLANPNTCLTTPTTIFTSPFTLSSSSESSTGVTTNTGINADITTVTTPSHFMLQHQFQVYFENKLYEDGSIFFQPATLFSCEPLFTGFPDGSLEVKTVYIPQVGGETVVAVRLPPVCDRASMLVKLTLDKYDKLPDFIQDGGLSRGVSDFWEDEYFQRIVFTDLNESHVGAYNFKLQIMYQSTIITDYQYVFIQPAMGQDFGVDIESEECGASTLPSSFMTFGGVLGNIYADFDLSTTSIAVPTVDGTGSTIDDSYIICGANKDVNNMFDLKYYQSFVQLLTAGHAVKWHQTISAGSLNNVAVGCHFATSTLNASATPNTVQTYEDQIVVLINSQSAQNPNINDTVYIIILSSSDGQLIDRKMISNTGLTFEVHGSVVLQGSDDNGDIYINGLADGAVLATGSLSFYVMRMTRDFDLVFYQTFDFGSSPVGGTMLLLASSSTLYQLFGFQVAALSPNTYRWGLTALSTTDGTILNSGASIVTLKNSTFISRDNSRAMHHQALYSTATELFTCFIYKLNSLYDEAAITRHDPSSLLPANSFDSVEFNRGYLVFESCDLSFRTTINTTDGTTIDELIVALGAQEQTYLFAFDVSDPTVKMSNLTQKALSFYHQRFIPIRLSLDYINSEFTLFIRSYNFDQMNEERLFKMKFTDLDTPAWSNACSSSDIDLITSNTFYSSLNIADDGIYLSQNNKWSQMTLTTDYTFTTLAVSDWNTDQYLVTAGNFGLQSIQFPQNIYRDDFLKCSRYTVPTPPSSITLMNQDKELFSAGFQVSHIPYRIQLNEFTTCSNDYLEYSIAYQNGQNMPQGLFVIDPETLILTVHANSNTQTGYYKLRYQATPDGRLDFVSFINFNVWIHRNQPPQIIIDPGFSMNRVVATYHTETWVFQIDENEPGDYEIIFQAALYDNTGLELSQVDWFNVTGTNTTRIVVTISDPPISSRLPQTIDYYYLLITTSDEFNTNKQYNDPQSYYIEIQVQNNQIPVLNTTKKQQNLGVFYPGQNFLFTLDPNTDFIDSEGDTPVILCNMNTNMTLNAQGMLSWLTGNVDPVTGVVSYSGVKPTNADTPGSLSFICSITDSSLLQVKSYIFTALFYQNKPVVVTAPASQTITLIREAFYDFGQISNGCYDPEKLSVTKTVLVNGQLWSEAQYGSTFNYDSVNDRLSMNFNLVSQVGTYQLNISCSDNFNPPVSFLIIVLAKDNTAPSVANLIPTRFGMATHSDQLTYPYTEFDINVTSVFSDPDPQDSQLQFTLVGSNGQDLSTQSAILYAVSISYDKPSQTILSLELDGTNAPITYNLKLIGTDSVGNTATTPFSVLVKKCDSTCLRCTDDGPGNCTRCQTGLLFEAGYCLNGCKDGFYLASDGKTCTACPVECAKCTGPLPASQCSACTGTGFLYTNTALSQTGCLTMCPSGLKKNYKTHTCVATTTTKYQTCLNFIQSFDTTETYTSFVGSIADVTVGSHSCTGVSPCDGVATLDSTTNTCTWPRQLYLWCEEVDDVSTTGGYNLVGEKTAVMIRVATNSLPDHCLGSFTAFPTQNMISFEVEFSRPTTLITTKKLTSQSTVDSYGCSLAWLNNDTMLESLYNYNEISGSLEGLVGVSISGAPFHSSTSEFQYDAFFPKSLSPNVNKGSAAINVDACLGSNKDYTLTFYQYFSVSPCFFANSQFTPITTSQYCENILACNVNPLKYTILNLATNQRKFKYIGIARDGHMIVGPYDTTGNLWQPCQLDACNGITVNGEYVYASSLFFPYTVGCWGSASGFTTIAPSCSSNTNVCSTVSQAESHLKSSLIFLMTAAFISLMLII